MGAQWFILIGNTVLTFVVLLALVRWIGSTQLSQVTFFNWVAGASMGNVAANMLSAGTIHDWVRNGFCLVVFTAATILTAVTALKFRRFRRVANGEPTIVVHRGVIQRENLKKAKLNIDTLLMMLRQQGCFSPQEVNIAILEATGSLSVLPVTESQTASKADLVDGPNLSASAQGPYTEIIVDGEVDYQHLVEAGYNQEWLTAQLAHYGARSIAEVTFLGVNAAGKVIADTQRFTEHPEHNR